MLSSHSFCLLTVPGASCVALYSVTCPLLLETVSNKLLFQWQSSPGLLASPYLNYNKTFILKHSPTFPTLFLSSHTSLHIVPQMHHHTPVIGLLL